MLIFFFVFLVTSFLHIFDHAKVLSFILQWIFPFVSKKKEKESYESNALETKQNTFLV
jgi:hypothetical protein